MLSHRSRSPPPITQTAGASKERKLVSASSIVLILLLFNSVVYYGQAFRMVRLCIASVDPVKLSSQCVMCNRREFPLTVIDCTGINKVNDLISNPLTVEEATCLIYNCRRQVPDVKPEPHHGSVSNSVRPSYASASGTRSYEMMPPAGMFGGYATPSSVSKYGGLLSSLQSPKVGSPYSIPGNIAGSSFAMPSNLAGSSFAMPSSLAGGSYALPSYLASGSYAMPSNLASSYGSSTSARAPNFLSMGRQQALPYAVVPAPYSPPFGLNRYKAALVPLFR